MNIKKLLLLLFITLFFSISYSQKLTISQDLKYPRSMGKPSVITADKTGVYIMVESLESTNNMWIGFYTRASAGLIKYDIDLKKVYDVDYNSYIKKKQFEKFIAYNNKLYLLASSQTDKSSNYKIEYIEIDKSTGNLMGEFKTLVDLPGTANLDKKQKLLLSIRYNKDSSKIIVAQGFESEIDNTINTFVFTPDLTLKNTYVGIKIPTPEAFYELQDIIPLNNGYIIFEAKILELINPKKKCLNNLQLSHYQISLFDVNNNLIKNIKLENDQEKIHITHSAIFLQDNELKQICFYTDIADKTSPIGILVNKIDQTSGNVEVLDNKLFSETPVTAKTLIEGKKKNSFHINFTDHLQIDNISFNADKSINVAAQEIWYSKNYRSTSSQWVQIMHEYKEFVFFKINEKGKINWVSSLPTICIGGGSDILDLNMKELSHCGTDFFEKKLKTLILGNAYVNTANKLHVISNDNEKNIENLANKLKEFEVFSITQGSCYDNSIDLSNGSITRNVLTSNKKLDTSMPGFAYVVGNSAYYIIRDDNSGRYKMYVVKVEF